MKGVSSFDVPVIKLGKGPRESRRPVGGKTKENGDWSREQQWSHLAFLQIKKNSVVCLTFSFQSSEILCLNEKRMLLDYRFPAAQVGTQWMQEMQGPKDRQSDS